LTDQNHNLGLNLPIDIFFRSLAEDLGENAIGIILSGTGSDGTLGIRAIKGAGGMAMVQDEKSAKFDGMPKSALATGLIDFVSTPEKMGEHLENFLKHPFVKQKEEYENNNIEETDTFSKILAIIRTQTGVDFTYYKPNTIVRRIERRMSVNQLSNLNSYSELLSQSPSEAIILYKELLIGVTRFFRDTEAFDVFNKKVVPELFKSRKKTIRVWTTGCSTGEEAYSIAILFKEYMDKYSIKADVKIFATDIDKEAIEYASNGVYPESIAADVSEDRLSNYFVKESNTFKVSDTIRQMVIFAQHNIIKDPPFSKIDLAVCRNLLIYLQPVMQKKVLSAFSFSLNSGGILFLGSSETIGDLNNLYSVFDNKWKIYKSIQNAKVGLISDLYVPSKTDNVNRRRFNTEEPVKINNDDIINQIEKSLFEEFVPPSIIINKDYEILHVYKDVNKYLKVPTGKMNFNLNNMITKELSVAISTAVHRLQNEKKEIVYRDVTVEIDGKEKYVTLRIKPYDLENNIDNLVLIAFEENEKLISSKKEYSSYSHSESEKQRILDLEQELKHTKENLQATIEELETSNEELQATNEELIASNEELQSTNEELQSVNEELYTVNSEYQNKIEELTELNNDINNWFNSTNIGTLFLDLKLRIRKFTNSVKKFVNIIENDVGRPFGHISYNFKYDELSQDIDKVLDDLQPVEREVVSTNGEWLLIKILPYRTVENAVKGIVITFVDINKLKTAQLQLKNERDLLVSILENSPNAKTMVDKDGQITFANKKAEEILGLTKDKLIKLKYNSPDWKITDIDGNSFPDENLPFEKILKSKQPVYDIVHKIEYNGNEKTLKITGSPILDENNEVNGAVFIINQIDNVKDE
jgi:two-component system CheB/CheR fusion protein